MIGLPATVSLYFKSALLVPPAMVRLLIVVESDEFRKIPPEEVVVRFTAWPPTSALTGLSKVSRSCRVMGLERTPAVSDWGEVVTTNLAAAAGLTTMLPEVAAVSAPLANPIVMVSAWL